MSELLQGQRSVPVSALTEADATGMTEGRSSAFSTTFGDPRPPQRGRAYSFDSDALIRVAGSAGAVSSITALNSDGNRLNLTTNHDGSNFNVSMPNTTVWNIKMWNTGHTPTNEEVLSVEPNGNLWAWYKCSEGAGLASYDSSGNGRHGAIINPSSSPFGDDFDNIHGFQDVYSFENQNGYTSFNLINPDVTTWDRTGQVAVHGGAADFFLVSFTDGAVSVVSDPPVSQGTEYVAQVYIRTQEGTATVGLALTGEGDSSPTTTPVNVTTEFQLFTVSRSIPQGGAIGPESRKNMLVIDNRSSTGHSGTFVNLNVRDASVTTREGAPFVPAVTKFNDALGGDLQFKGLAPQRVECAQSNCFVGTGTAWLGVTGLLSTDTFTVEEGSDGVTISNDRIDIANGHRVWGLRVFRGGSLWAYYPMCEEIIAFNIHTYHDVSGNGRHLRLSGGSSDNRGRQDSFHYYHMRGGRASEGESNVPGLDDDSGNSARGTANTHVQNGASFLNLGYSLRAFRSPEMISADEGVGLWFDEAKEPNAVSYDDLRRVNVGGDTNKVYFDNSNEEIQLENIATHGSTLNAKERFNEIIIRNYTEPEEQTLIDGAIFRFDGTTNVTVDLNGISGSLEDIIFEINGNTISPSVSTDGRRFFSYDPGGESGEGAVRLVRELPQNLNDASFSGGITFLQFLSLRTSGVGISNSMGLRANGLILPEDAGVRLRLENTGLESADLTRYLFVGIFGINNPNLSSVTFGDDALVTRFSITGSDNLSFVDFSSISSILGTSGETMFLQNGVTAATANRMLHDLQDKIIDNNAVGRVISLNGDFDGADSTSGGVNGLAAIANIEALGVSVVTGR